MRLKRVSLQSIVRPWSDNDTRDMLPQRCPNCDWSEESAAGAQLRFHMRLQRVARIISVSLLLLLGVTLATLVLLLFGPPASLRRGEKPPMQEPIAREHVSEKLQSGTDPSHPNALFTIKDNSQPEWWSEVGNAHKRGNLNFHGRNLSVPTEGLYRLYLQITFNFESTNKNHCSLCNKGFLHMLISVEHISPSYPSYRPLLISQDTMSCNEDWSRSMYTSGTFQLEADTQIQVEIHHPQLINTNEAYSFFGIELISAQQ